MMDQGNSSGSRTPSGYPGKPLAAFLLCLFLAGCYETVAEAQKREKLEQRVKELERAEMNRNR